MLRHGYSLYKSVIAFELLSAGSWETSRMNYTTSFYIQHFKIATSGNRDEKQILLNYIVRLIPYIVMFSTFLLVMVMNYGIFMSAWIPAARSHDSIFPDLILLRQ